MNKKFTASLIIIVIILATLIGLVFPMWSSVWQLKTEIKAKEIEIEEIKDILEKTELYKRIEKEAEQVFLALPKQKDIPNLLIQFDTLAFTNEMTLERIDFSETVGKQTIEESTDPFPSITVDLSISGDFKNFKKYLKDVEINIRAMDVISINFDSGTKDEIYGLEFNLEIKVYYQ